MQNFLNISGVVDSVRSNAGSALKSVQRQLEESALKAAGLGEEEETLYRLNKNTQAYLRAVDSMQQAAKTLADDFAEAMEDVALREIARKFRDTSKVTNSQQLTSLTKELAEPVRKACEADDYATRVRLVNRAFTGLLGINLDCVRSASTTLENLHDSTQTVLKEIASRAVSQPSCFGAGTATTATRPSGFVRAEGAPAKVTPPPAAQMQFDDLLGGMSAATSTPPVEAPPTDLLDFGFDMSGVPNNGSSGYTAGASPTHAPTSSSPLDFDFDSFSQSPAKPNSSDVASTPPSQKADALGGMVWPSKEDESESQMKDRVEAWKNGKNIRAMLVSLHEVAPSSAGWVAVKLSDVMQPADVKTVYRKAVLKVHPDKLQGSPGQKRLGHLVFEALCDQWKVFQISG